MDRTPREDKRLKALGLALLAAAAAAFLWAWAPAPTAGTEAVAQPSYTRLAGWGAGAAMVGGLGLWLLVLGCGGLAPRQDERRRRSLGWQLMLLVCGVPLVVLGMLSEAAGEGDDEMLWSLLGMVALVAVIALWRRVLRHEVPSADELLLRDPRAPVLYLRSFKDDSALVLHGGAAGWLDRAAGALAVATPEQELAWCLQRVGPVVAIGKPGEPLPELGAARLYVAHEAWQAKVCELMQAAALVVLRVGDSPGVLWEVEQALALLPRQRLVLAMIGTRRVAGALEAPLAAALGGDLRSALAAAPPSGWRARVQTPAVRIGSLVCFAADGTPHVVPVRNLPQRWQTWAWFAAGSVFRPSAPPIMDAWHAVEQALRGCLPLPRRRVRRAVAVALAVAFGYAGAHWLYLGRRKRVKWYLLLAPLALLYAWWEAIGMLWMEESEFARRYADAAARES